MKLIQFTSKGMYCEQGDFYIDPWFPVKNAVVTHGHGDHARWGMEHYLCHHFTKPILKKRIGEDISIQSLEYGETIEKNAVKITLFPAGHIIGSAQVKLEYKGFVNVISGDYKLQDDGLSTPFESVKCHEFVTESTFGLPIYHWMEVEKMNQMMRDWVLNNQKMDKTSVFIGYSLGKAQRILKAVENVDDIYVHSSIARLNEAFTEVGIDLPTYKTLDFSQNLKDLQNKIIILPPALLDSNMIRKIPNGAKAICSGWMQVRGSRRWRSADAGFAVSDHADWEQLLKAIKSTQAEKVYVTHGYTEIFSRYLNEIGIEAEPVKTQFGNDEEVTSETDIKDNPS